MLAFVLVGCVTEEPCAEGFGRASNGACVALAADDTGGDSGARADDTEPAVDTDTALETGGDSGGGDSAPPDTGPDADGDGWTVGAGDCDDDDATRHPGATELLGDGVDADCDGDDAVTGSWTGEGGSQAGTAVAVLEGVVVVGAPMWGGSGLTRAGQVVLLEGEGLAEQATLTYSASEERMGTYVQTLGDVDGDGEDDLAVGTPYASWSHEYDGGVHVYAGVPGASATPMVSFHGTDEHDFAGWSMGGGDVDGDGLADLVVGGTQSEWGSTDAPAGGGRAFVVTDVGGQSGSVDLGDAIRVEGRAIGDHFGYQVRVVTGPDGLGRIAVGAVLDDPRGVDNAGSVYLFDDPPDGATAEDAYAAWAGEDNDVEAQGDRIGWGLDRAGDFDGDGYEELIIGCPQGSIPDSSTAGNGRIYIVDLDVEGQIGVEEAPTIVEGADWGDRFGMDVAGDFDANGDGELDLLVGAPERSAGGSLAGAAYLVLGPISGTSGIDEVARVVLEADGADDNLGWGVAAGDLDADGLDDLVLGSRSDDAGGGDAGAVFTISGRSTW